jgi:N-acetylglucosaminyldiphosphoundecaprenol N-acetyl-beta-D-mannosaminyltransferase
MARAAASTALPPQRQLFGLPFDAVTRAEATARCTDALADGTYVSIGVVNAAKVIAMRHNAGLRQAVVDCEMILADGQSVVWASRMLGEPLPERVAGIDLFNELLSEAARLGHSVYFLGARADVLERMLAEVSLRFPALPVAGARDGYFQAADEPAVVAAIRDSGAEMLFLGMSSPKKELFLTTWGQATGARVVHGVGGSFDIMAGLTVRAPLWYQRHGLEWLYRAKQEPLRLGRRYLTTNFAFMAYVGRELVRSRLASSRIPGLVHPGSARPEPPSQRISTAPEDSQ